ncbi:sensor histidine kinase, partial [Candidatus Neomarinimicrobiota bacterium]
VALAIPMLNEANSTIGLLLVGPQATGTLYDQREIDFLAAAAGMAAQAIERINLQQALVLEQAETRRLEELSEMKSYFVSSVSHDLKSPLTSIKMFAEMMTDGKVEQGKIEEYGNIIQGESTRLSRMIENVLDFAKIEKGIKEYSFEEIDLNRLITQIMSLMEYQFKLHNFDVDLVLDDAELVIDGDADALMDAAYNLLNNSLKYSAEDRYVEVRTYKSNSNVCVRITDRGVGIPLKQQKHIFDPFYRGAAESTNKAGGTGLGLSVVKHIMDAHHGKIELTSEPGKGSTFTLHFLAKEV